MKKFILSLCLLTCGFLFTLDRKVQMPSSQELKSKLQQDFSHFIENTDIVSDLADRKLPLLAVNNVIELAYYAYFKKHPNMKIAMQMNRAILLSILLNNDDAALQEFRKVGIIK